MDGRPAVLMERLAEDQSVEGWVAAARMMRASRAQRAAALTFVQATLRRGRHRHRLQAAEGQGVALLVDQWAPGEPWEPANHVVVLCIGTDRIRRLRQPKAPYEEVER